MRRLLTAACAIAVFAGCNCSPEPVTEVALDSDGTVLTVTFEPFGLTVVRPDGVPVGRSAQTPLTVGLVDDRDFSRYYDPTFLDPVRYPGGLVLREWAEEGAGYRFVLDCDEPGWSFELAVQPAGGGAFRFDFDPRFPGRGDELVHTRLSFAAEPDDRYWGLGEWFDTPEHHGRVRNLRFDLMVNSEAAHNQVHVRTHNYVTRHGFGVLLDSTEPLTADMASEDDVHLTLVHPRMGGWLVARDRPVETLMRQQQLVGLPPLWPDWAFAPQQWRNAHPVTCTIACADGCNASETGSDLVLEDARAMRDLDLPASVMWIDAPWQTGFNTFEFNPVQFPDAAGLIDELHRLGYRVVVWASPFINEVDDSSTMCGMEGFDAGSMYSEAERSGYLVLSTNGEPVLFPWRGTIGALVDFTNPEAFEWWKGKVRQVIDLGVEGFKLDFDEYVNPSLEAISLEESFDFFDGTPLTTMHGRYHELYHRAFYEALEEAGVGPGFIIARTGSAFDAAWTTAIWPGDLCSGFEAFRSVRTDTGDFHAGGLPAAISAGVSLSASLHPHYGSDIGGYKHGMPEKEPFGRWIQFGALSTIMQLGGGGEHHNPWDLTRYDTELLDLYARYARLHMSLMPYLYSQVARNTADGTPIIRPSGLDHPDDLALIDAPHQYLFGEDLLVAPVVTDGARERSVVFPAGRWVSWWTDEVVEGPGARTVAAPFDVLPLFAREGSVIPMLSEEVETVAPASDASVVTSADRDDVRILRVYPGALRTFEVHDGTRLETASTVQGQARVSISAAPRERRYEVRMVWQLVSGTAPGRVTLTNAGALELFGDRTAFDAASAGAFYEPSSGVLHARFTTAGDTLVVSR